MEKPVAELMGGQGGLWLLPAGCQEFGVRLTAKWFAHLLRGCGCLFLLSDVTRFKSLLFFKGKPFFSFLLSIIRVNFVRVCAEERLLSVILLEKAAHCLDTPRFLQGLSSSSLLRPCQPTTGVA